MNLLQCVPIVMTLMVKEAAALSSKSDSCSGCDEDGDSNTVSGSQDCAWSDDSNECFRKDGTTHCFHFIRAMLPPPVDTSHGDGCIPPELNFDDPDWPMCK